MNIIETAKSRIHARDADIVKRRKNGESFSSIARLYEITPTRVSDLYGRACARINDIGILEKQLKNGKVPLSTAINLLAPALSVRALDALANTPGVHEIGDAIKISDIEFYKQPNIGHKTVAEIRNFIDDYCENRPPKDYCYCKNCGHRNSLD